LRAFFSLRETPGLKKKPTTSELLDRLKLLLDEDVSSEILRERVAKKLIPPLHGARLKNERTCISSRTSPSSPAGSGNSIARLLRAGSV
jgi:hypothetical protein